MANLIYKGLKANLPAERNATSFYLTTDTRELFFGANLYTEAVRFFTTTKPANPAQGVLYMDLADGTGYAYDGSEWKVVITGPSAIKNELIGASTDESSADTIYGAKKYGQERAAEVLGSNADEAGDATVYGANKAAAAAQSAADAAQADATQALADAAAADTKADTKVASVAAGNGAVEIGGTATAPTVGLKLSAKANNDLSIETDSGEEGLYYHAPAAAEYTIAQQATAETGYAATYYLTKDGSQVGSKINIPKDFLVKSASVETVTTADVPYQGAVPGDKYIDFVINASDSSETAQHIYLPVNELVDVYTSGSAAGDMVVIAIDGSNQITATITDGTVTLAKLAPAVQTEINKAHEHSNKALLDTYTQTEANLADAVNKKHEHANKSELDLFATGDKQKLDDAYEAITVGSF